jgi:hypothetical protein
LERGPGHARQAVALVFPLDVERQLDGREDLELVLAGVERRGGVLPLDVLEATLALRSFLFGAVYENTVATAEFAKAEGILGGLWERVRARPEQFLDPRTLEAEGLDAAARDFIAGMTDRFAVRLYERLFIPTPWVELGGG